MKWLTVHVGGQAFGVYLVKGTNKRLTEGENGVSARIYFDECKIYISSDLSEQAREDSLLHELLHAAVYVSGARAAIDDATEGEEIAEQLEERIVTAITPVLHRVLKDLGCRLPKRKTSHDV
jgi:hypothetical protein